MVSPVSSHPNLEMTTRSLLLLAAAGVIIGYGRGLPVGGKQSEHLRSNTANTSKGFSSDDFVWSFPVDEVKPKFSPRINVKPACANGQTYCENIDEYPSDYIENTLLNGLDEFMPFFGADEAIEIGIGHKFEGFDETSLCASRETVVYPRIALTKEDKWLYVVNQGNYTQSVRVEGCLDKIGTSPPSCAFSENFPLGYKAVCKQKHVYRELVALNEKGEKTTSLFPFPSCCTCVVKTESLIERFASMTHVTTPATSSKKKKT